ncbi:DUF982 domain-containing protein [Mesorhizobium sp. ANAO-SY3R2]|uniref:DUF982 domain-containing protein n=1 Tax=Mesorhizobium sp. ANAO-SY3R2 TaxID=3166644 RepID=UPI00366DD75D
MLKNKPKKREEVMDNQAFARSLFIKDGRLIIREITCIDDALAFLGDWPENRRGPIYHAASRACHAARCGHVQLEGARAALQTFARSAGVLEQAPVSIEPWMLAPKSGRGGIKA